MAIFPDVLATTYLAGGTPVVKAVDLNAMQAEHVRAWRALRGNDFLLFDDFVSSQLDTGIWNGGTVPPSTGSITFGDTVPGALGVVQLNPGGGSVGISTFPLPLGTLEWRLAVRARFPNYRTLTIASDCQVGILNPFVVGDNNIFRIRRSATGALNVTAVSGDLATEADTGVAVPVDAYATFEIRRFGNNVTFIINDIVVYVAAYSLAIQGSPIWLNCSTPHGLSMYADFVKFWAVRQPVSSPTG